MRVLKDFNKAIAKLNEVLQLEKTEVIRDAAIKRFEHCFDLAWKTIKSYAKQEGLECFSPRECFKTGFSLHLIEHDEIWFKLLEDRNLTSHLYKEEYADEVYSRLPQYLKIFEVLASQIKKLLV